VPGEAHAAEHIDGERPLPVIIWNREGVLDLEHADIVDQDIDLAGGGDDVGNACGRGDIARRRRKPAVRQSGAQTCNRLLDVGRLTAIDDHFGAVGREVTRNRAADALGGAGHESAQAG
jgi:hypothetical protein